MRAIVVLLAFAALVACGGADYIMSTTSGEMIETNGRPTLNQSTGMYNYRTKAGKDASIRKDDVVQILER